MKRRWICMLLTVALFLSLLPAQAFDDWPEFKQCPFCDKYIPVEDSCPDCGGCNGEGESDADCFLEHHCHDCGGCYDSSTGCEDCHCCERCLDGERKMEHCPDCKACFVGDDPDQQCPLCRRCPSCAGERCIICGLCEQCFDICPICHACDNCLDLSGYHCVICGECRELNSCPDDFSADHCGDCCMICDQCGRCALAAGLEICPDCNLCEECCAENTRDLECSCGICVESPDWESHICPDCGLPFCQTEGPCEYCGLCLNCCSLNSETDLCVENPGYVELFCPTCNNLFEDMGGQCPFCGQCIECCRSDSGTDFCLENPEYESRFCPKCGGVLADIGACDICGLCLSCCYSASACSEHMCAEDPKYEAHICTDCGRCFHDTAPCGSCLSRREYRCADCCRRICEALGCNHLEWCCSDPDFQQHLNTAHVGAGEHPAEPQNTWTVSTTHHWKACRYCDDPEHSFQRQPHRFDKNGYCAVCGYHKDSDLYIVRQPRSVRCVISDMNAYHQYSDPMCQVNNRATFRIKVSDPTNVMYYWDVWQGKPGEEVEVMELANQDGNNGPSGDYLHDLAERAGTSGYGWEVTDRSIVSGGESDTLTIGVPYDACRKDYSYYVVCRIFDKNGNFVCVSEPAYIYGRHLNNTGETVYDKTKSFTFTPVDANGEALYPITEYESPGHKVCCASYSDFECSGGPGQMEEHHYVPTGDLERATDGSVYVEYRCKVCNHLHYVREHRHMFIDEPGLLQSEEYKRLSHFLKPEWEWVDEARTNETHHTLNCMYEGCSAQKISQHNCGTWSTVDYPSYGKPGAAHRWCLVCNKEFTDVNREIPWDLQHALVRVGNCNASMTTVKPGDVLVLGAGSLNDSLRIDPDSWTMRYVLHPDPNDISVTKEKVYTGLVSFKPQTGKGTFTVRVPDFVRDVGGGGELFISCKLIACTHDNKPILRNVLPQKCCFEGYTGDLVCPDCGKILTPGTLIPAPSGAVHEGPLTLLPGTARQGSCTQRGYEGTFHCAACGYDVPGKRLPRKHGPVRVENAVEPDCFSDGYSGDEICTLCGQMVKRGRPLPAKHPEKYLTTIYSEPATCQSPGYTGDTYCTKCRTVISEGYLVPKAAHSFSGWVIVEAPTPTKAGTAERSCTVCGLKDRKVILPVTGTERYTLTTEDCWVYGEEEGVEFDYSTLTGSAVEFSNVHLEFSGQLPEGLYFTGRWKSEPALPEGWYEPDPDEVHMIYFPMPGFDLHVYPEILPDHRTPVSDLSLSASWTEPQIGMAVGTVENSLTADITAPAQLGLSYKWASWYRLEEATGTWKRVWSSDVFSPGIWRMELNCQVQLPESAFLDPRIRVTCNGAPWTVDETPFRDDYTSPDGAYLSLNAPPVRLNADGTVSPLNDRYLITFRDLNPETRCWSSTMLTGTDGRLPSLSAPPHMDNFLCWQTEDGSAVTLSTVFTEDTCLYAAWKEPAGRQFIVTYDPNGGTEGPGFTRTRKLPADATIEVVRPSRTFLLPPAGMEFAGMEIGGRLYAPGEIAEIRQNLTVKYLWKASQQPTMQMATHLTAMLSRPVVGAADSSIGIKTQAGLPYTVYGQRASKITVGSSYASSVPMTGSFEHGKTYWAKFRFDIRDTDAFRFANELNTAQIVGGDGVEDCKVLPSTFAAEVVVRFDIPDRPAGAPLIDPGSRNYTENALRVLITPAVPGQTIYYTLDGTEPSPSNGETYRSYVPISGNAVLKAVSWNGRSCSPTATAVYTQMIQLRVDSPLNELELSIDGVPYTGSDPVLMLPYGTEISLRAADRTEHRFSQWIDSGLGLSPTQQKQEAISFQLYNDIRLSAEYARVVSRFDVSLQPPVPGLAMTSDFYPHSRSVPSGTSFLSVSLLENGTETAMAEGDVFQSGKTYRFRGIFSARIEKVLWAEHVRVFLNNMEATISSGPTSDVYTSDLEYFFDLTVAPWAEALSHDGDGVSFRLSDQITSGSVVAAGYDSDGRMVACDVHAVKPEDAGTVLTFGEGFGKAEQLSLFLLDSQNCPCYEPLQDP